jgi:hypothetical protein
MKPVCPKVGCLEVAAVVGYYFRDAWFEGKKVRILFCRYKCESSACKKNEPVSRTSKGKKKARIDRKDSGIGYF